MALHDLEAWLPSPQAWPCDIGTTECKNRFVFSKHEQRQPMAGLAGSGVESRKQFKGLPVKV
ncbi:hypothetical protein GT037_002990 [Alternaria burnsii]|uniref:Uncharacterized protein n=1 Tax=Alternaria burnsii TaxID=1187904 RepID=A0A8H7BA18_9PLEO|nr:uncharacterized protein GT037_002990 [Alternaria burnsii]KAF7679242.1 hypothetical protein GT037_002990 [Alternaria burnsii]